MKPIYFILLFLFSFSTISYAQPTEDNAVQCWLEITDDESSVTIHWLPIPDATTYRVYRKNLDFDSWEDISGELSSDVNEYLDSDIDQDVYYDYYIAKTGDFTSSGYIHGGIKLSAEHYSDAILLLVDSLFVDPLSSEIAQLITDLRSEGWRVIREDINRENSVSSVKEKIVEIYEANDDLKTIFCLGHIPVPYAGNYAYDGHNNHVGAWPADGYYAEMNGNWTDATVNNTSASQARNHNVPDDGKFDNTIIPSDLELEIGRVDFYDLPLFEDDEIELIRQYLDKDHRFRIGEITAKMRGVIDDNFGTFGGEAFAASAWKNFGPLVGPENVASGDYRTSMNAESYMWSYGCGGGSYTSAGGIGTTANFAEDSLQGIFSNLFGSYFGDWDSKNNFMRASLAQGTILTSCWSGRPHWFFHHMGMGKNIGYSAKLSMNNSNFFIPFSFLTRRVHMGLMGDPTLKMYIIPRPENLVANFLGFDVELSWVASEDESVSYYLYRKGQDSEVYELLNEEPIAETNYLDICIPTSGKYEYLLRATKLETTPSGSFHNLSSGIFTDVEVEIVEPQALFEANEMNGNLTLINNSTNSNAWFWDFGDMNTSTEFEPLHVYEVNGDYTITLTAHNTCFQDSLQTTLQVIVVGNKDYAHADFSLFPNPTNDLVNITGLASSNITKIEIIAPDGSISEINSWQTKDDNIQFSLEQLMPGMYYLRISLNDTLEYLPLVKK